MDNGQQSGRGAPTLVVMAAGMGSRYGKLKQIDPVGPSGEIVLDYAVYDALQAGFGRVVFIIRPDIEEAFREVVEPHLKGRIPYAFVHQRLDDLPEGYTVPADREKPWGTAHAILACEEEVQEPFAVVNADDFYGPRSYQLLCNRLQELATSQENRFCMVGFTLANTLSAHGAVTRGVCHVDENHLLQEVIECKGVKHTSNEEIGYTDGSGTWQPLSGLETASMNMWGFTPRVFPLLRSDFQRFLKERGHEVKSEFLVPEVVDQWIKDGRGEVEVLPSDEKWLGVTYPEDKELVQNGIREMVEAGRYPRNLWGSD